MNSPNLKPYLIKALYDWCNDNFLTPYVLVYVNKSTLVPMQYVVDNKIVLNIGPTASNNIRIEDDFISFSARFAGKIENIYIPMGHILNMYSKETGQGMSFELEECIGSEVEEKDESLDLNNKNKSNNFLKIIKK